MSANLTYLITGAGRGIGKGLVSALLQLPSTTVIAGVRDTAKESSSALSNLPKAAGSKLILVKIDSTIESDPAKAVSILQKDHGIQSLDVVIAVAGISHSGKPVIQTLIDSVTEHFALNTVGPVALFQATAPLLKTSKSGRPTFIAISSIVGSIGGMELLAGLPAAMSPYGASKAALNWFIRRIHFEEEWLTSFVFHPGLVMTDMGMEALKGTGVDPKDMGAISVEESIKGMMNTIGSATREISGTFQNYDGKTLPW